MSFDDDDKPPIEFVPHGDTEEIREANLALVEPSPGFDTAANFCCDIINKNSEVTVLDFTQQSVTVRFQIDGIWHGGPPMDRESGDFMLATIKQMAGMNFRERRQRQEGRFKTIYLRKGQKFKVVSQGVPTGERVALYLEIRKPSAESAEELGMRKKMREEIGALTADPEMKDILVVAVPGEGYTTAWRSIVGCADRLTRDFYVLQPVGKGDEEEIINVFPCEFDPAKGEDAMSPVPQLLLKQPDILAFEELPDGDLINRVIDMSIEKKIPLFTRQQGKHCVDGLLRLLAKGPDIKKFVDHLDTVIAMRVIRKLCTNCRIGFTPHPQLLQQLGLPPGRVAELFQPFVFKPGMLDDDEKEIEPCPECSGIGFKGRVGLFEKLNMTDPLRQAIAANPKNDYLQKVAKQQGHISMFMEGVVLIAKGITSVDELQRVLKS
ncbi:MAG: ATPase, T2SS/T4P/T4SS family [Planctomycetota bacterium]